MRSSYDGQKHGLFLRHQTNGEIRCLLQPSFAAILPLWPDAIFGSQRALGAPLGCYLSRLGSWYRLGRGIPNLSPVTWILRTQESALHPKTKIWIANTLIVVAPSIRRCWCTPLPHPSPHPHNTIQDSRNTWKFWAGKKIWKMCNS